MVLGMIFAGIALLAGIGGYIYYKWPKHTQPTLNEHGVDVSQHRGTIFDNTMVPAVKRSKFFPDDLYIGRMAKLDTSLKYLFKNVLFGFPVDPLIVSKFAYFDVDNIPFEEVHFDKIGTKDYILLYDSYEKVIYFLNKLMTFTVPDNETPQMILDGPAVLEEAGERYEYEDFSGLIKVRVTSDGDIAYDRLIRVYQREINADDNEYAVMMMDKPGVVSIYVGFNIGIIQLEQI